MGQWLAHYVSISLLRVGGAGSIPAVWPGRFMSFSCAVKFPAAILYGVVICNFDEDL